MKNHILLIVSILTVISIKGYGQNGFPYQAVLRDNTGTTINNQNINVLFSIYQGNDETPVYQEEHSTTTNAAGQFSLEIGAGHSLIGDFQSIDWSKTPSFIQVEADYGSSHRLIGRQELLSVPYAQYADQSGTLQTTSKSGKNYQLTVDDLGILQVVEIPEGYTKLVFQDEFNGTGLPDESKWGYEVGFIRNHEMQYYTERRVENVFQNITNNKVITDKKQYEIISQNKYIKSSDIFIFPEIENIKRDWKKNWFKVIDTEYPAVILFTSGSVFLPKGVVLTTENLLNGIEQVIQKIHYNKSDVIINWMPLTHVAGLLLLHLIPLCSGANEVVVSTEDFLRNPRGFFDYVKKYKGTVTMFPNFAVEMLVNYGKKNDISSIDISSLRCVFNGAEPINCTNMYKFIELYKKCGLIWFLQAISSVWRLGPMPSMELSSLWMLFLPRRAR